MVKHMMKSKKMILLVLVLLCFVGVAAFLFGYNQTCFIGNRVKNADAYLLDIERMNGSDQHKLELYEADILQIQFETTKGTLYLEIKAPNGTSLYRGHGKEISQFTVNIEKSGCYTIVVEAHHASGMIHIHQVKEKME